MTQTSPTAHSVNAQKPFSGILSIFRKELIQLFRDKYLVAFIVTLPIIQLLVTGLAIQRDLQHIPTLVYNYDNRNESFEVIKSLENSDMFDIDPHIQVLSEQRLMKAVRSGKYRVGIVIPPDFSEKLLSGSETAEINIVIDGTQANVSKMILDAAHAILANHGSMVLSARSLSSGSTASGGFSSLGLEGLGPPIEINTKVLNNPEMKSSFFLIPGILGIIMHMMTVLFTSFSIVREREAGTLEQLMVSPVRVSDLMIGKVLPYSAIGLVDMALTLGVMVWVFDIPVTGSFWFLTVASIIFIINSLGLGLLISTTCRSQVQAIQLTIGLLLPSLMLSGFVFPVEPMPWFIKIVTYSLPLTYYLEIIRGVVLKGIGLFELWPQTLILAVYSVLLIGLSIVRFKKQVS